VRAEDVESFDRFVRARLPRLLKLGRALAGDEHRGADLVQDALERTLVHWSRLGDDPEAYVRRAMVNRSISVWRRERRELTTDRVPDSGSHDAPADSLVLAAIRELPPRQRAVVALRYLEDLSEAQTAAVLGCSVGTVKSQTSRAMAKLRALIPTTDGDLS
jgi:RNA polymerase sigma-70 factor (sigma-E family)